MDALGTESSWDSSELMEIGSSMSLSIRWNYQRPLNTGTPGFHSSPSSCHSISLLCVFVSGYSDTWCLAQASWPKYSVPSCTPDLGSLVWTCSLVSFEYSTVSPQWCWNNTAWTDPLLSLWSFFIWCLDLLSAFTSTDYWHQSFLLEGDLCFSSGAE